MQSKKYAFSLVELSIVLVILGLLTGGILAGQSLIRAAELRAVPTEIHNYTTAVMSFRDKYFALPGDMANATVFWGPLDGNDGIGSDCGLNQPATGLPTCNGNGNGLIGGSNVMNPEGARVWQHLANAGLIAGNYTGSHNLPNSGTSYYTLGVSIPASKYPRTGIALFYRAATPIYGRVGNAFQLGGVSATAGNLWEATIRVDDAYNIDVKMDDGRGDGGKLRGSSCMTAADSGTSGDYLLDSSTARCMLWHFNSF